MRLFKRKIKEIAVDLYIYKNTGLAKVYGRKVGEDCIQNETPLQLVYKDFFDWYDGDNSHSFYFTHTTGVDELVRSEIARIELRITNKV